MSDLEHLIVIGNHDIRSAVTSTRGEADDLPVSLVNMLKQR
jgi:hypothetical protein